MFNNRQKNTDHLGGHMNRTWVDSGALIYMKEKFGCLSLLDIGCGPGHQLDMALNVAGYYNATGIDGDHSLQSTWENKNRNVILHDFTISTLPMDKNFDLAWSVEFLEHVEEKYQENYMLVFQKCKYACVTAAPPGSPGHHHVNCQSRDYWIDIFCKYGFEYLKDETIILLQRSTMNKKETRDKTWLQESGMIFKNFQLD